MLSPLPRQQASSKAQALKEGCSDFSLPSWFLANNVKTTAELNDLQPPCRLVFWNADNNSEETERMDKDKTAKAADGKLVEHVSEKVLDTDKQELPNAATGSTSGENASKSNGRLDQGVDTIEYQVSHGSFSELRDITAALLIRDQEGQLSSSNAAVLLCSPFDLDLPFVDGVILHLAKDLQATLVSVDLEDLEDLGWEFNYQDQQRVGNNVRAVSQSQNEPDRDCFFGMAMHYFGARSKRHSSRDAWNRTKRAITAILDTQLCKCRPNKTSENDPEAVTVSPEPFVKDPPPLLLYIRDSFKIIGHDSRLLARFRDSIRDKRLSGHGVVLVTSFSGTASFHELGKKISAGRTSTVSITPFCPEGKVSSTMNNGTSIINTRRLKRFLRWHIPHLFVPEVLKMFQPYSTWALGNDGKNEYMGASQWTDEDFQRAITQITGRAFGIPHIDLKDVRVVLSRLGLLKAVSNIEESNEAASEDSGEMNTTDEITSETGAEPWIHKLHKIKSAADQFEKSLISCIVNPDDIECTYDDVIVDEETKETVRHLVSLSNFQPEATSTSLLKQIRINGALFYGPPGTGKTHLCRAIAKASGASMLAIDSATVHSKYVGETEKLIKAVFKLSKMMFPCVLFIDEVDALFYRRSSGDRSWHRSALTQFLLEMDGLSQSDTAPFVVVATNRPRDLDEAFYRRLPQKIFFGLPNEESRSKILRLFLKDEDLDPLVDINSLARQTNGYSGSDLRSLCAEAALIWAIEQVKVMSNGAKTNRLRLKVSHFAKSLNKIRPSVSKQQLRELSEFSRQFGGESSEDAFNTGLTLSKSMTPEFDNFTKQSNPSAPGLPLSDQIAAESETMNVGATRSEQKPDSGPALSGSDADPATEAPNLVVARDPSVISSRKRKRGH